MCKFRMFFILFVIAVLMAATLPVRAANSLPEEYQNANKLLLSRFADELYNQRKLPVADEIFSQDVVLHQPAVADSVGLASLKKNLEAEIIAFPDAKITTVFAQLSQGKFAGAAYFWEGTPFGASKKVQFNAVVLVRVENGKIAELWQMWDAWGALQQKNAFSFGNPSTGLKWQTWDDPGDSSTEIVPSPLTVAPVATPWEIKHGTTDMKSTDIKKMAAQFVNDFPKVVRMDGIASTFVLHQSPSVNPNPVDFTGFMTWLRQNFTDYPDMRIVPPGSQTEPVIIVDGDIVMILYNLMFTVNQEPSGNSSNVANGTAVSVFGLDVMRIEHKQIVELWMNWDNLTMMRNAAVQPAAK